MLRRRSKGRPPMVSAEVELDSVEGKGCGHARSAVAKELENNRSAEIPRLDGSGKTGVEVVTRFS